MANTTELVGKVFGMLKVVSYSHSYRGKIYWNCVCECGNIKKVTTGDLKSGNSKSCGCYSRHKNRVWMAWNNMKARCYNPNNKDYKYYGGKGIKMCKEWKSDFWNFRDWALKHGYKDNLTIDRIDVNNDYTPDNCRWVTMFKQCVNKGNTCYIYYKNIKVSLKEMCVDLDLDYYRIYDYLRSPERTRSTTNLL